VKPHSRGNPIKLSIPVIWFKYSKLDFFLIRAFGDDEQRLLRHVVYDVSKREGIDLLFCGDCIEEGSNCFASDGIGKPDDIC
jgi:hypothetical protein